MRSIAIKKQGAQGSGVLPDVGIGILLCLLSLLAGCASTEDLYADYDANSCPVQIAAVMPAKTVIRDRATAETMLWRQAVYFEFDEDLLTTDARARLDDDIKVLKRYPVLQVAVRGFTDERGSPAYNLELADRRTRAVQQYLRSNGLIDERMKLAPLGEQMPLVPGDIESAWAVNRRVELLLLDQRGQPLDFGFAAPSSRLAGSSNAKPLVSLSATQAVAPEQPSVQVKTGQLVKKETVTPDSRLTIPGVKKNTNRVPVPLPRKINQPSSG